MRTRVLAVLVAVVALLAPATVAQAAPSYGLTLSADLTTVYPHSDGYRDTTTIQGEVDAGPDPVRIRGSVVITIGTRVAKVWPLRVSGPFDFTWNGRAANGKIVTGTAQVSLRLDGQPTITRTLKVSGKRVVATTFTRTQIASDGIWCFDRSRDPDAGQPKATETLCSNSYGSPIPDYAYMTMRGTKTEGGLLYVGRFWDYKERLKQSVRPAKVTVTAKFTQSGSGTSTMYVMPFTDYLTFGPGTNPVRTFHKSSTVTVTGYSDVDWAYTFQPEWVVLVPKTVNLRVTKFTIKVTYYVLK